MSLPVGGVERRLGVALSGGGYRAACFHLGLFDALAECGLLDRIDMFSGVSGGSLAAATLLCAESLHSGQERLARLVAEESILAVTLWNAALDPFRSRVQSLATQLGKRVLGPKTTLVDLARGPRLYLNSTNLASGNLFFFVTGKHGIAGLPEEIGLGEWQLGFHANGHASVPRAVAASCAFPPVFNPLELTKEEYPPGGRITLTDGGVYENLGVRPLLHRTFAQLDYVIVSDGGKSLAMQKASTRSGLSTLLRAYDVMIDNIRGLLIEKMQAEYRSGKGPRPLWFTINSEEGSDAETAKWASAIPTDLAALGWLTVDRLRRHARGLALARLEKYAPELLAAR